jgi:hypothetical protein
MPLLLTMSLGTAIGQEVKRPPLRVPEVASTPAAFVPKGWEIHSETLKEVDLNGDGRPDAAFVISTGKNDLNAEGELQFVKPVLVLALRGSDGKLHRSIVNDGAVLDGNEGGVFGDPFDSLRVERGAVVISHYGGSRDRWSYTHRYRYQNGQWMLIGLTTANTDTLDLEHFDEQDVNLSTGLVEANQKGDYETPEGKKSRKPEISGSYYELEAFPVEKAPIVDGQISAGEWPGFIVRLNSKQNAYRNPTLWRGVDDLSAQLHAARIGESLFVCAEVTDNEVTAGDTVRVVTKRGIPLKPVESKITPNPNGKGYVFEARYSLKGIGKLANPSDQYAGEELESFLHPSEDEGVSDFSGFQLQLAVEVVDVDDSQVPKARSTLSTRLIGSPYNGAIRIFRKGPLVLTNDYEQ